MTRELRLDVTPHFQPAAILKSVSLGKIDGLAHLKNIGLEPSQQRVLWLGPVWVRDDGESLTALAPDHQLPVVWASPNHPDTVIEVALLSDRIRKKQVVSVARYRSPVED